jgi:hypothetical protein
MEDCSNGQSASHAEGVRQLLGPGESCLTSLERLIGITKIPQCSGGKGEAGHPGVIPVEEDMGTVLLGIIEGNRLLRVFSCLDKLAKLVRGLREQRVSPDEKAWVVQVLSQGEDLLSYFMRRLELPPREV